jgi:hypothetical protein
MRVLAPSEVTNLVNRQTLKVLLVSLVIFYGLGLIVLGLKKTFMYPYDIGVPVLDMRERQEILRSLGLHIPTNYRLSYVGRADRGENVLAVLIDNVTGQKLVAAVLREHLRDRLDYVSIVDGAMVEDPFSGSYSEFTDVPSFRVTYALPLIHRNDDLTGIGEEALVKGITETAKDRFETATAEVVYVQGEFARIGLFKQERGKWVYPTPGFDFKTRHEGALAFIKSKASGRVVIYVGVNSIGQFDEQEFQEFVRRANPS